MSFDIKEASQYSGQPRELYWFMRGVESWAYSSGITEDVEMDSQVFQPLPGLSRSNIKDAAERGQAQLTVTMPRDALIAKEFIGIPNIEPVWLYVYRVHEGEIDFRITWQGRIRVVEFQGNNAKITLDNIKGSTKKSALRALYQNQCNHFTFDANCGLLEADYTVSDVEVLSLDTNVMTIEDADRAAGFYRAGQVRRSSGDRRFVVSDTKVGDVHTLTLLTPFEDLAVGDLVDLIGGACLHTFGTCQIITDKTGAPVDNSANYGGYPKVPRKDPFKSIT
jgi:uncharacterized phage protein (TIGR02218 family)